uniref:N-acetyltransferase 9 n=1 Tax=Sus scrofa TaxID=9823 RepID=A0A8D0MPE8_PIG
PCWGHRNFTKSARGRAWEVPETLVLRGPLKPVPVADASVFFPLTAPGVGGLRDRKAFWALAINGGPWHHVVTALTGRLSEDTVALWRRALFPAPGRSWAWSPAEGSAGSPSLPDSGTAEVLWFGQEGCSRCTSLERVAANPSPPSAECTFIVLAAEKWQGQPGPSEESCMAGDVNLFLTDLGDPSLGEIEVMIAEPSCRGQGLGTEAVLMMMAYGVTKLGLTTFEAKIGQENEPSIRMFRRLHFEQVAVSSVFQEVTLRLTMSEPERQWLLEQTSHVQEKPYRDGSSEPH